MTESPTADQTPEAAPAPASMPTAPVQPAPAPIDSTRRWAVVVVLAFAAFQGPYLHQRYEPNSWLYADGSFYFATVRAITEHGRLEQHDLQPDSWYAQDYGWNRNLTDDWSNVALGRNGGWYPKHAILLPLLSVLLYLPFGMIGTLATNVGINLIFVLLVFLLGRRVARPWIAAAAAAVVAANPFVQYQSYSFSNDTLGTDFVLGAIEASLAGAFGLGGVLAGLSIWSRITNAAFLPALMLVGWDTGGKKGVTRAALFSLIPLGVYGVLNTYIFGAPWITSYQRVIVRENGVQRVASHTRLFNVPWEIGLRRIVFGPAFPNGDPKTDGAFATFPALGPGLAGVLVMLWKRWRVGLAVLIVCTVPVAVFMTYDWYRPHFLYPMFGASAMGLAALAELLIPGRMRPTQPAPAFSRGARIAFAAVVGAVFVVGCVWQRVYRPDPARLSSHVKEMLVKLEPGGGRPDIPCDYFNVQEDRWECSSFDHGGTDMTGAILRGPVYVHGQPRRGIWMQPNQTRWWRSVTFPQLDASAVDLDLGLGDQTRPGLVDIQILARGQPPIEVPLRNRGEDVARRVTIAPGDGPALQIRWRADDPSWKQLVVDGILIP